MAMLTSLVDGVEELFYLIARSTLLSDVMAYCQLETAIGGEYDEKTNKGTSPTTLVTKQNALLTMLRVNGTMAMVSGEVNHPSAVDFCNRIIQQWSVYLRRPGHRVDVVFERDPTTVKQTLTELLKPALNATKRIQLDMSDIFISKVDELGKVCASESVYMIIMTDISAMSSAEIKSSCTERAELAKKVGYVPGDFSSQNFYAINKALIQTHNSFVNSFKDDMRKAGVLVEALDAHEACRTVRASIDPEHTDVNWKAVLPGDRFTVRSDRNGKKQILPQALGMQLMSRAPTFDDEVVKVGNRHYVSACMSKGPETTQMFAALFNRVQRDIPWRITFQLTPEGMRQQQFGKSITGVLGFISDSAKQIKASFDHLEEEARNGNIDLGVRILFQTWGNSKTEAQIRSGALVRAVQGWGSCQTSDRFGDPAVGFFGGVPAFSNYNGATAMPTPISEAVRMLPLPRPASPWPWGAALFRTDEGRIFPVQPGSSLQDTWGDIFFAPPGSGKSFTMNTLNMAACFAPDITKLPFIGCIDIGVSSSGLIEAIQSALPPHMRHMCIYKRLQNNEEWAINPLDTHPGCRLPDENGRMYLKSLLVTLGTPIGVNARPYPAVDQLAEDLIKLCYKKFSDKSPNRKMYEPTVDPIVDAALEGIPLPTDPSWWEVVDLLWVKGKRHESTLAQRYAVPTLSDLAGICNSSEIREIYCKPNAEVRIDTNETLVGAMERLIIGACDAYPLIATTTKMDLGEARIISLDLNDVAPDGGPAEKRQSAIFFMFARHLLIKNICINTKNVETLLRLSPKIYHKYHTEYAEEMESVRKIISIDELHRTGGIEGFRIMLRRDMREGRKWNMRISLASQFMEDFDDEMIKSATSIYAMRYIDDESTLQLKTKFGFSSTSLERYKYECLGPKDGYGAPFLVLYKTKVGTIEQILVNTTSPIETWALTTRAEDMALRRKVYSKVPGKLARQALAAVYPSGCKREYEKRALAMGSDNSAEMGLYDLMAAEVIAYAEKHAIA